MTTSDPIIDIANDKDAITASLLDTTPAADGSGAGTKSIFFFWADWHAPSSPKGLFDTVIRTLAGQQQQQQQQQQEGDGNIKFYRVLAEECPKLSRKHNVTTVPTFVFCNADGSVLDRIDGGEDVARVTQSYAKLVNASSSATTPSSAPQPPPQQQQQPLNNNDETDNKQSLNNRLQSLLLSSPIMLFLKGTPSAPRCGFSRQAIEMLTSCNVSFGYFDILEDDDVRQGLKEYSDWPTYPQLYVRGELVGGLDIMKEMMEDEDEGGLVGQLELQEFVIPSGGSGYLDVAAAAAADAVQDKQSQQEKEQQQQQNETETLNEKLQKLTNRHRIMLFMKGIPSSPKCGFSRQIVEILDSFHVSFDAFNILEDEEVRQGLKEFSDWPTFPQLYVEGDLVGGLDIVKEMMEGDDLKDLLTGGKD